MKSGVVHWMKGESLACGRPVTKNIVQTDLTVGQVKDYDLCNQCAAAMR